MGNVTIFPGKIHFFQTCLICLSVKKIWTAQRTYMKSLTDWLTDWHTVPGACSHNAFPTGQPKLTKYGVEYFQAVTNSFLPGWPIGQAWLQINTTFWNYPNNFSRSLFWIDLSLEKNQFNLQIFGSVTVTVFFFLFFFSCRTALEYKLHVHIGKVFKCAKISASVEKGEIWNINHGQSL